MWKRITTFTILFFVVIIIQAQQDTFPRAKKTDNRYWTLGVGLSFQSMYDEAISYVRYHGSGLAPSVGLLKISDKKYRQFLVQPTFIKLTTDRSSDLRPMAVMTTRVLLNYQYLVAVKQWIDKSKLFVGGEASFLFNFKRAEQLDNSQVIYDYALALGPAGRFDKPVKIRKRDCTITGALTIPIISHIARPYYLNRIEFIDPKNNFVGDLFNNSSVVTINKNFRITTGIQLTYPIFNKNLLRLGYNWDFYKMRTINNVYAAEHLISVSFLSNY